MNIKYLLFDYGGTIDTNGIHWGRLIWYFYRRNAINVSENDFYDAYVYTERTLDSIRLIQPTDSFKRTLSTKISLQLDWLNEHEKVKLPISVKTSVRKKLVECLYNFTRRTVSSNANVLTILKQNGYHIGLVSNFYGNLHTVLSEMGLGGMFEVIVESTEANVRKPDPYIYSLAAERMKIKKAEDVMVIGDSYKNDIIPATSLGFNTAWIRDPRTTAIVSVFDKKYSPVELKVPTLTINKLSQIIHYLGLG